MLLLPLLTFSSTPFSHAFDIINFNADEPVIIDLIVQMSRHGGFSNFFQVQNEALQPQAYFDAFCQRAGGDVFKHTQTDLLARLVKECFAEAENIPLMCMYLLSICSSKWDLKWVGWLVSEARKNQGITDTHGSEHATCLKLAYDGIKKRLARIGPDDPTPSWYATHTMKEIAMILLYNREVVEMVEEGKALSDWACESRMLKSWAEALKASGFDPISIIGASKMSEQALFYDNLSFNSHREASCRASTEQDSDRMCLILNAPMCSCMEAEDDSHDVFDDDSSIDECLDEDEYLGDHDRYADYQEKLWRYFKDFDQIPGLRNVHIDLNPSAVSGENSLLDMAQNRKSDKTWKNNSNNQRKACGDSYQLVKADDGSRELFIDCYTCAEFQETFHGKLCHGKEDNVVEERDEEKANPPGMVRSAANLVAGVLSSIV